MSSICYIASAGAGKTTLIVNKVCERLSTINSHKKIAVITYTIKNQEIIASKLDTVGCKSSKVIVLGWYYFIKKYWIDPFKGDINDTLYNHTVQLLFSEGRSDTIKSGKTFSKKRKEDSFFSKDYRWIYSDKLSEAAEYLYKKNKDSLIRRLSNIFDCIFLDEVQDFAGYDFDIIRILTKNSLIPCTIVADPRQCTYVTNRSAKNPKYTGNPSLYISEKINSKTRQYVFIDDTTLVHSHRCIDSICELASALTPQYPKTETCICVQCEEQRKKNHTLKGCFLIKESEVSSFINQNNPVALTWDINTKINSSVMERKNMGESKGCEFDAVLLYPTQDMRKWIKDNTTILCNETRAKFYVAVTRAKYLVGIVVPENFGYVNGIDYLNEPLLPLSY